MSTPLQPALRILQIEDSAEDAELTFIELREAGLCVECLRVDDEGGLRQALDKFRPQLILSDLNLPGFSAAHALQLAREHLPAARFIVFSGTDDCDDPGLRDIDGWLCKIDAARLPDLIRDVLHIAADAPA